MSVSKARREYLRNYQREWMARRRAEWFLTRPCVDCGDTEDLQLDHVDASQKVTHAVWSWSKKRRDAELAKCVSRCFFCHQAKTLACGEIVRGEANGRSKFTEAQVLYFRSLRQAGLPYRKIQELTGVDYRTVWHVCKVGWQHLPPREVA